MQVDGSKKTPASAAKWAAYGGRRPFTDGPNPAANRILRQDFREKPGIWEEGCSRNQRSFLKAAWPTVFPRVCCGKGGILGWVGVGCGDQAVLLPQSRSPGSGDRCQGPQKTEILSAGAVLVAFRWDVRNPIVEINGPSATGPRRRCLSITCVRRGSQRRTRADKRRRRIIPGNRVKWRPVQ